MKNFKKLIKEAHLGNPLNEDRFKKNKDSYIRISEPNFRKDKNNPNFLSAYIKYDTGPGVGIALGKETMAGQIRRESSAEALRQMEIIGRKLEDSFDLEDLEITDLENGVVELFAVSDDFIDMDPRSELSMAMLNEIKLPDGFHSKEDLDQFLKDNPFDSERYRKLSIAQKQDILSYLNRDTEKEFERRMAMREEEEFSSTEQKMIKQIKSYKKRGSAMITLPYDVRDFYFKNKEKIDALNEEFKKGDKVTYLGNPAEITFVGKDQMDRTYYSVAYDKGNGRTKASNLYNKDGEIKAVNEDINDPVLMKARAAQMKRDAIEKKDLENKSKRISADKAIDLRYELSILNREREDILMRIEDIGVEMEQTAEPEGGEKADELGERLMAAERELREINSKIIDIKDDLGVFDMNESVNEAIDRATTVYQIATPAPQSILVGELKELFPNKEIVTEVDDADGYESVLMFDLSGRDLKTIKDNVGTVLVWKYPIGKAEIVIDGPGKIRESVNEGKYEITYEDKDDNRQYVTIEASSEKKSKK